VALVGAGERLDLDDVRAHVSQILICGRTLQKMAKTDNLDAIEQHPPFSSRATYEKTFSHQNLQVKRVFASIGYVLVLDKEKMIKRFHG
jgi:hypothetical protein